MAALVGRALGAGEIGRLVRARPARVTFAALASDGADGSSGAAGAIVDARFAARAAKQHGPGALDRAIAGFDTATIHRAMGTAVGAGPSGHNLADLHVLLVETTLRRER